MIKIITDNDFYDFLMLYEEMQNKYSTSKVSTSVSVYNAIQEINTKSRLLLGAYINDKLVGFVIGYSENKVMYFTNIYCGYKKLVKNLVSEAEKEAVNRGCIRWEATAITKEGRSLLKHLGKRK